MTACHRCCRGRPLRTGNATLWKINLATGALVWAADRGVNSVALHASTEGADTVIYECGGFASSVKSLTKWIDHGDAASKVWTFDKSGLGAIDVRQAPDSSVWLTHTASTTITRVDTDGAEINSGTAPASQLFLAGAAGSNMYVWREGGNGVWLLDSTFGSLGNIPNDGSGNEFHFPRSRIYEANGADGWVKDDDDITGGTTNDNAIVRYDASLTEEDRTAPLGGGGNLFIASASKAVFFDSDASLMRVYDIDTLTEDFTISSTNVLDIVFDDVGNMYSVLSGGSIKGYDSLGNLLWSTSILSVGSIGDLLWSDGHLIRVGEIDVFSSSDNYFATSYSSADGSFEWGVPFPRWSNHRCAQIHGGYLYTCGVRVVSSG